MEVAVVEQKDHWLVEAIDDSDGDVFQVRFYGIDSEYLALEYASWKYGYERYN